MVKSKILAEELVARATEVSLKDFKSPAPKFEKGMTEICELPDEFKRLFAVMIMAGDACHKFDLEMQEKSAGLLKRLNTDDPEVRKEVEGLRQREQQLSFAAALSKEMFWTSIKAHFLEQCQGKDIVVCAGYKLCTYEHQQPSLHGLLISLDDLFGRH